MEEVQRSLPSILVPYAGPEAAPEFQDIFVYMRPGTNGVEGESAILKVIERCPEYRTDINLVYLANIPGDFIVRHHIVERHYAHKLHFAVLGRRVCTSEMRRRFEQHFAVRFDEAQVIGSFEALKLLGLDPESLFETWVDEKDLLNVNGQTVKKIGSYFVINYDIPALLHKNSRSTDIAVMVFRTRTSYEYFGELVERMRLSLIDAGLMSSHLHAGRAFHYSKSPFEQILDGMGYLHAPNAGAIPLERVSFCSYLLERRVPLASIIGAVQNPIALFVGENGEPIEDSLFSHTHHDSYAGAFDKLMSMRAQFLTDR